ncbi:MAG: hypothetical protein HY392_03915 [Candidatus Diapherotrites archaeon]|nr:hypothetical protein [Candidatus Diapherotrites archaeon]
MGNEKSVTLIQVYKKLENLEKLIKKIEKHETQDGRKEIHFLKASESSIAFWDNEEDEIWNEL